MPTMPVNEAGWRIEPPVSVPGAPRQILAATAAAEPDEKDLYQAQLDVCRVHGLTTPP